MQYLHRGDQLSIERTDGRFTHGAFVRENESYLVLKGTIGNDIGHEILLPRERIIQIVVVKKGDR